ncbi:hypothetical protein O3G_MSEX001852 [Manduca sexta]|uniref:Fibronectin type-III domain-containing protein n=1 Tax=Manduca sexta TaxID=7130 RepID=A0A922CDK5_MANSE|nr:hypothetical protein O3G_MSEX001852 [Manduca sexta]
MGIVTRLSRLKCGAYFILIIIHIPILQGEEQSQCPSLAENPICPCYNFKEGLFLECPSATPGVVKNVLSKIKGTIQSLSIYDLESSTTELKSELFPSKTKINNLQISQTHINKISSNAFTSLRDSLGSLSIISSKLSKIPHESIIELYNIESLDLQLNDIKDIQANTFGNLKLKKLNLKGNKIANISENAFYNLEESLVELDMTENFLSIFPLQSLGKLNKLSNLRLSWNKINLIPDDINATILNLVALDLNSNYFTSIGKNWFRSMPQLKTLTFYSNQIENIDEEAFFSLQKLETVDLKNPLTCNCESQDVWRWMLDHNKIVKKGTSNLRCDHPEELHGSVFIQLQPQKLCDVPVIVRVAIQDIQTYSVIVSWQSRNQSGLYGYQVAYFPEQNSNTIRGKILNATARSTRLNHLTPGSRYTICVLAVGNFGVLASSGSSVPDARIAPLPENTNTNSIYGDEQIMNHLRSYMNDSMTSKCASVRTIEIFGAAIDSPFSNTYMGIADILTRRLSLVVGCCIGFIVFVVLVSALGYIKTKKREVVAKAEVQQAPQYISYDNFNTPNVEVQTTDMDINTITDKTKPQCEHE